MLFCNYFDVGGVAPVTPHLAGNEVQNKFIKKWISRFSNVVTSIFWHECVNQFLLAFLVNSHTSNFRAIIILQNNSFFFHICSSLAEAHYGDLDRYVILNKRKFRMMDLIQDFVSFLFPFLIVFKLHKSPSNIRLHLIMYTLGLSKNFLLCFPSNWIIFRIQKWKRKKLVFSKTLKFVKPKFLNAFRYKLSCFPDKLC